MSNLTRIPVEKIDLGDLELWEDGFPHAIFERLRWEDPVHWSPMATCENEPGVLVDHLCRGRARDQPRLADVLLLAGWCCPQ